MPKSQGNGLHFFQVVRIDSFFPVTQVRLNAIDLFIYVYIYIYIKFPCVYICSFFSSQLTNRSSLPGFCWKKNHSKSTRVYFEEYQLFIAFKVFLFNWRRLINWRTNPEIAKRDSGFVQTWKGFFVHWCFLYFKVLYLVYFCLFKGCFILCRLTSCSLLM